MAIVRFSSLRTGLIEVDTQVARVKHAAKRFKAWSRWVWELSKVKPLVVKGIRLSYAAVDGWNARDINLLIQRIKKFCGGKLYAYAWVAELQKRGAPHYHLCLVLEPSVVLPFFDEAGWWRHGSTNIKNIKGPSARYLTEYMEKFDQKGFGEFKYPKSMRMFAVTIQCSVSEVADFWFKVSAVPGYVYASVIQWIASALIPRMYSGWKWGPVGRGLPGWLIEHHGIRWFAESEFIMVGFE